MNRLLLILLLYIAYKGTLFGQETFNKRDRLDFPAAVYTSIVATDTAYYITGLIADSIFPYKAGNIFLKLNLEGNVEDVKTIRSTTKTYQVWDSHLINLEDGSFITNGIYSDSLWKALIIKYDTLGNLEWTKQYPNFFKEENKVRSTWIIPDKSNGYMICNNEENLSNNVEISFMRINSQGEIIWRRAHGTNLQHERSHCIIALNNNEFIVGGETNNVTAGGNNYISQTVLFAIDSTGQILWQYLSPASHLQDGANSMVATEDGGLVIASGLGEELVHPAGGSSRLYWKSGYIFKLDANRNMEWDVAFKEPRRLDDNRFDKIIAASDGSGYLVAGQMYKYYGGIEGDLFGWLAKVSPEGDSLWSRKLFYYELPDSIKYLHYLYDLEETPDGGFIMVGQCKDLEHDYPQQGWVIKVDNFGCLVPGCQEIEDDVENRNKQAAKILIYPNPVSNTLNVFCQPFRKVDNAKFSIIDNSGYIHNTYIAYPDEGTYMFPVENLPAGNYFLQYTFNGGQYSIPFIKQ